MKFLISAYGCESNKGSEPGVGWHWSVQFARFGEVWVITRKNNKDNIIKGLKNLPYELASKMHFVYYDTGNIVKSIKKGDHNLYPYYFCWQIGAYKKAKKLCEKIKFDYCIALTFGSIWMPTFMYRLSVPFIWGPIGGGESIPDEYLPLFGKKAIIIQKTRKLMMNTVSFNPLVFMPLRKSKYIITRTDDTSSIIQGKYKNKIVTCLETAIDSGELDYKKDYSNSEYVEFVYTGRLIKIKGIELVIQAISLSKYKDKIRFTIIGEGPERECLEKLTIQLGLKNQVFFVGKKDRAELLVKLKKSDVYIFPSFKEGGSWALMEAMGTGLPVICLDNAGMHITTDDKCAIRIKVSSINNTIKEYAKAIDIMVESRQLRQEMGEHARQKILTEFNWDSKGEFIKNTLI